MATERRSRAPDRPIAAEPFVPRDRVHWGSVIAGLLTSITILLILGLLGTAIGMTIFTNGTDGQTIGTGAAIWGVVSLLLAFLIGGWMAAWTSGVTDSTSAMINGFLVAVAAIVAMIWLVGSGIGFLFGAVTANLEVIADVGTGLIAGDTDVAGAESTLDDARVGTWATLIGLVVALGVAALGGLLGQHDAVTEPTPADRRTRGRAEA